MMRPSLDWDRFFDAEDEPEPPRRVDRLYAYQTRRGGQLKLCTGCRRHLGPPAMPLCDSNATGECAHCRGVKE